MWIRSCGPSRPGLSLVVVVLALLAFPNPTHPIPFRRNPKVAAVPVVEILELDSEGEDDMEPDESMAARDHTLLQQVDTDLTGLKCGEDGVEDDDDWAAFKAAHSRRIDELYREERKREIHAKLPLVPFHKYIYDYQYSLSNMEVE